MSKKNSTYITDLNESKIIKEFSDKLVIWNYPLNKSKIYYSDSNLFASVDDGSYFELIKNLMEYFEDDFIYFLDLMILESSENMIAYKDKFKHFPIVKFTKNNSEESFWEALHQKFHYKDNIYYDVSSTNTYSIIPTSGKWYIYGDYDTHLSKLVLSEDFPIKDIFPKNWNNTAPAIYEKEDMKEYVNNTFNYYTNKLKEFNR